MDKRFRKIRSIGCKNLSYNRWTESFEITFCPVHQFHAVATASLNVFEAIQGLANLRRQFESVNFLSVVCQARQGIVSTVKLT